MLCNYSKEELIDKWVEYKMNNSYSSGSECVEHYRDVCGDKDFLDILISKKYKLEIDIDKLWDEWTISNSEYCFLNTIIDEYVQINGKNYVVFAK